MRFKFLRNQENNHIFHKLKILDNLINNKNYITDI